jgi:DNA-binding MarR family transcriptional regulator/GNAT superfamily N-acetyltransferase
VSRTSPATSSSSPATAIAAVRGFNRFYTRQLGLLDRGLLGSEYTLTEARVLYELARRERSSAADISRELGLDAGYLSRMLRNFARRGYVTRSQSRKDARRSWLGLTARGRAAFLPLDRAARRQIAGMIRPLSGEERQRLVLAMNTAQGLLEKSPHRAGRAPDRPAAAGKAGSVASYRLRAPQVGDLGWVIHRQGLLYAQEYGWDDSYEHLVAEILVGFVRKFDASGERAWIAECDGHVVGSVFLVRKSAAVARLRLLYVEPDARGLGIGRHLVTECIAFARARGYRRLTLWTNDVLTSARRIYEAADFRLVRQQRHHSFGKDLVGQTWDLAL